MTRVFAGYSTALHCAGSNNPEVAWYKDTSVVSDTSPLEITSANKDQDETSYYCALTWPEVGRMVTSLVTKLLTRLLAW